MENVCHYENSKQLVAMVTHLFHVPRTKSRFVDKLPLFQFPTI